MLEQGVHGAEKTIQSPLRVIGVYVKKELEKGGDRFRGSSGSATWVYHRRDDRPWFPQKGGVIIPANQPDPHRPQLQLNQGRQNI